MRANPFIQVEDPLFGWTGEDIVAWTKLKYSKENPDPVRARRIRDLYEAYRFYEIEEEELREEIASLLEEQDLLSPT
jgi:hypothetical protein